MYQNLRVKITGLSPLLMHNGRGANPLDPLVKQLKTLTGKRKKTDEDLMEIARLEWMISLYEKDGVLLVPAENVEGCFRDAAKMSKRGKDATRGFLCRATTPLQFAGKGKSLSDLWNSGKYTDTRVVKNPGSGSRIMRTRPILMDWSFTADLSFDDATFNNETEILDILQTGGQYIGLLDYRPRYGRFSAEASK